MHITSVHVFPSRGNKVKAYAKIVFDGQFVVHDLRIVFGGNGLFVAMPWRRRQQLCDQCAIMIDVDANYCKHCGSQVPARLRAQPPAFGCRANKLTVDVCHPLAPACRELIETCVLAEYHVTIARLEAAKERGAA